MADIDSDILAQLQEKEGEAPGAPQDAAEHGWDTPGLCKSPEPTALDQLQPSASFHHPAADAPAVVEPVVPSKKRGLVAVTKKPAAAPPAAGGTSAPNNIIKDAAALGQPVAVKPKQTQLGAKKPAAAAAAKPAVKKAAPQAKAPAEPKKKAAKANKESSGPKVKRAKSAFMFFCSDRRSTVKAEHPDFTMGDLSKELARLWKELATDEKAPFEALATEDKERAGNERREAKAAGLLGFKGAATATEAPAGRSKKAKQPRAKSAYQLYCDSKRAEIKAASPGADFKTLSTLLGAAWKSASDDEKAPFLAQNQELKAQLEADNPKPAVSSKAARAAPPPAASLTSASDGPDCQSGADAVVQSSGHAEESAAANAPAAAKAAGTAAKVKAKAPAKKRTAAAPAPSQAAAAAAAEGGDDEEDSIEQELMSVDWEANPAEYIVAETFHSKYLVKRKGLDFSACGLVDAAAAKRQRLAPPPPAGQPAPGQAARSACPVSVAMMDDFDAFTRSFACAVHAHSDSGELDLDDLNQESPLEMCSLLGILREPHFPLSKVADKNKDVMIKVPMMGVSRAVQRVVSLERTAAQAEVSKLRSQLAQLSEQLKGTKGEVVPTAAAAAAEE